MSVLPKIRAVNQLFRETDATIKTFIQHTGYTCIAGCGSCCQKTDIEATVLEFLPAAFHTFITGNSDMLYNKIEEGNSNICVFYNPFLQEGSCSQYPYRGLICRLFGFSKRQGKTGQYTLLACKPLKSTSNLVLTGDDVALLPDMSATYMALYGIDPQMALPYYPINHAIKRALAVVSFYFQYKRKPA